MHRVDKKPLFLFVLIFITSFAVAQRSEVGFGVGTFNYTGDLVRTYNFKYSKPAATVFYRSNLSKVVSFRVAMTGGKIGASEKPIDPDTYRSGSVWDLTFSRDPQQTYIYAANGVDEKINILLRSTLEVLTSFGDGGRGPGPFFGVHNLATDSKGNIYTAEVGIGRRAQKFVLKTASR